MRFPLHKVLSLAATLSLLTTSVRAQTVSVGYFDLGSEGFVNTTYHGSGNGFINLGTINSSFLGAGTGQTGDAIIVTPISDPVLHFNTYNLYNFNLQTITSVTFRLPQYAPTDPNYRKLGFLDTGATTFGIGNAGAFNVSYADPLTGTYNGDGPLAFQNLPVYSTLHFWGGGITNNTTGNFSFYAAYPATNGLTAFIMDVAPGFGTPSSTPNTTFFNTATNPSGGIVPAAVTPELPGAALFVPALLPVVLVARRRRRS
ncbi:hypothetical protein [Armatimonas rosea]|uniref:PEP-CTERM sorting domain-containing protein n=1 Tax=Armatimonas rosea TaxID=685828 RepID=A0A7W9W8E3_ARMRO|nr:hypothetical protein [Armatimonas rosea]MBB6052683.1 hypothetical protein [Armatimonas rosea]